PPAHRAGAEGRGPGDPGLARATPRVDRRRPGAHPVPGGGASGLAGARSRRPPPGAAGAGALLTPGRRCPAGGCGRRRAGCVRPQPPGPGPPAGLCRLRRAGPLRALPGGRGRRRRRPSRLRRLRAAPAAALRPLPRDPAAHPAGRRLLAAAEERGRRLLGLPPYSALARLTADGPALEAAAGALRRAGVDVSSGAPGLLVRAARSEALAAALAEALVVGRAAGRL